MKHHECSKQVFLFLANYHLFKDLKRSFPQTGFPWNLWKRLSSEGKVKQELHVYDLVKVGKTTTYSKHKAKK